MNTKMDNRLGRPSFPPSVYIYDLPYLEREQLCNTLDQDNQWEELAGAHMHFDAVTIEYVHKKACKGSSPTDALLSLWGNFNHTILELFVLLKRMKQYRGMRVIRPFVDQKYHCLIRDGIQMPFKCEQVKSPLPFGRYDVSSITAAAAVPQIRYEELQKATNEWSPRMILGKGGFGTVFRGSWKCTLVAVKRIESRDDNSVSHAELIKQSITELSCLNAYRHDNVLPIYGYSVDGPHSCLVYQYMCGGSLDDRLHMRNGADQLMLSWSKRLIVAIGTARGLQFLHTIGARPLIHSDIKSANILLDKGDQPKIGDFGLAREGPHADCAHLQVSRIQGTRPYLPEEYLRSKMLSTKVDTFSFGVVLFELATALTAYATDRDHKFLKDHVMCHGGDMLELRDRSIADDEDSFRKLIDIGKMCVNERERDRPEMMQVLALLEKIY